MAKKSEPEHKEEEIAERTAPPGEIIYQAIYDEGEHELTRNNRALAMSGLGAGLSMGFSFMTEALLRVRLSDAAWTPLVSKLGYSIGFLVVIIGRQQLFTKNTLTVILPLLKRRKLTELLNVARLWAVVLAANLVGALLFARLAAFSSLFEKPVQEAFLAIASEAVRFGLGTTLIKAILSGWLIALMVWLLPFAESARIWVIVIISYVVALAGLPHIVAGAVETFYLVSVGHLSWVDCVAGYLIPTLIGNVIGGVALVAVGAHAEFTIAAQK